jgi:hypothetical protein
MCAARGLEEAENGTKYRQTWLLCDFGGSYNLKVFEDSSDRSGGGQCDAEHNLCVPSP